MASSKNVFTKTNLEQKAFHRHVTDSTQPQSRPNTVLWSNETGITANQQCCCTVWAGHESLYTTNHESRMISTLTANDSLQQTNERTNATQVLSCWRFNFLLQHKDKSHYPNVDKISTTVFSGWQPFILVIKILGAIWHLYKFYSNPTATDISHIKFSSHPNLDTLLLLFLQKLILRETSALKVLTLT